MDDSDCFAVMGRTRWVLRPNPLNPEREGVIDWSTLELSGIGTKHQRAYLAKSAKELLVAYVRNAKRNALSPSTVPGIFTKIRRLVRWMVEREIWRFAQLSEQNIADFLAGLTDGNQLSEQTFQRYVTLLNSMWKLKSDYVGAIRIDPIFLANRVELFSGLEKRKMWKAINEDAALHLIRDALQWVSVTAPIVQIVVGQIWSASRKCIGLSKHGRAKLMNEAFGRIERSEEYAELRHFVGTDGGNPRHALRRLLALSEGAAAIILLFLVGMRVSELLSLTTGSIKTQLHSDGHTYEYLSGVAAKKRGLQRLWIASSSVKAALTSVEALFSGPRSTSKGNWLFIAFSGTNALPLPGRRITRMGGQTIGKRLRLFADAEFRSGQPACGRLHPHAARKTFARFVVLRDKRALGALAHHYGHVHREYTDTNYIGSDLELAALISEENRRDLANGLTDILKSKNLSGKASKSLRSMKGEMGDTSSFAGKKALARTVQKLIDEGVTLAPCDWGYCVYVQSMSACGGDIDGPNPIERTPDVCSGCANFVVTEAHRSWWNLRAKEAQAFLLRQDIDEQSRLVVLRRNAVAEKLLSNLNDNHHNLAEVPGE
ncbi:tyrosine-type recombinase/integrase [Janthinobacterium lividum]|uniref:tyrosine-type recombinase/integrase n=1 Tax=Janthinobacterium lividum TaxID=29581 RepID=UPI000A644E7C|nr:tyrosine-type recombinase/integrase [Janthinobacterium lividum]